MAEDLPASSRLERQLCFVACSLIGDGNQNLQNLIRPGSTSGALRLPPGSFGYADPSPGFVLG